MNVASPVGCVLFYVICVHLRCTQCVVTSDGGLVFIYCL